MIKPNKGTYNPAFQDYTIYLDDRSMLDQLAENTQHVVAFFSSISSEKEDYAYAEGKWTIKQVLNHLIDSERVFQYRSLVAARNDMDARLSSFDQDIYANNSILTNRTLSSLIEEFKIVRSSSDFIFSFLSDLRADTEVMVSNFPFSARVGLAVIIGHPQHHLKVLKERYFNDI